MPATLREVLRSNTFEEQRQIINILANDFFSYSSGTGFSSFLNLVDGTEPQPALFFDSANDLGIFKAPTLDIDDNAVNHLGISSDGSKVFSAGSESIRTFRDLLIRSSTITTASVGSGGFYYKANGNFDVSLDGGNGTGAIVNLTSTAFEATITNGGSAYPAGTLTDVEITGGSGTLATCDLVVRGIEGSITDPGTGYTDSGGAPLDYTDIPLTSVTGSGVGARCDAQILTGGFITLTITESGTGYANGDILTLDNADLDYVDSGGTPRTQSGSGFEFTINAEPYVVTEVNPPTGDWKGKNYLTTDTGLGVTGTSSGSGLAFNFTKIGFISSVNSIVDGGNGYANNASLSPVATKGEQDAWLGIVRTFQYTVTVSNPGSGNRYYIDIGDGNGPQLHPNLTLERDAVYNFVYSNPSDYDEHPLRFATISDGIHNPGDIDGSSDYTSNIYVLDTIGSGVQLYIPPDQSPSTIYYYCAVHADMIGTAPDAGRIDIESQFGSGAVITVDSVDNFTAGSFGISGDIDGKNLTLSESLTTGTNAIIGGSVTSGTGVVINAGDLVVSAGNANISGTISVATLATVGTLTVANQDADGLSLSTVGDASIGDSLIVNTSQLIVDEPSGFVGINAVDFAADSETNPLEYNLSVFGTLYSTGNAILSGDTSSTLQIGENESFVASEKFSVLGDSLFTGYLSIGSGSASEPSLRFDSNPVGLYSYADGSNTGIGVTNYSGKVINVNGGEIEFYRNLDFIYESIDTYTIVAGSGYATGSYSNVTLTGGGGEGLIADLVAAFTVNITTPGAGYSPADYVNVFLSSVTSAPAGAIQSYNVTFGGSDYITGTYTDVPLQNGSGTNATVDVTVTGGSITSVIPNVVGSGYVAGESVSINTSDIGGSGLDTITIVNGGSGYTDGSYLGVDLVTTSGTGSGANANITVSGGAVTDIVLQNTGSNYSLSDVLSVTGTDITQAAIDTVSISSAGTGYANGVYPNVALSTNGSGTNATADITISGNVVTNAVINTAGSGYVVGDTLTFEASSVGGTGAGIISSVTVTNGGSGFTDAITTNVSVTGGSGANAEATVEVNNGSVSSVIITDGGSGYSANETLGLDGYPGVTVVSVLASPSGAELEVATVIAGSGLEINPSALKTGSGLVLSIENVASGTGGSGASADITVDGSGAVTNVVVVSPGSGYSVGDTLRVEDANMIYDDGAGGFITSTVPTTQMLLTVNALGGITVVNITDFGEGYAVNDVISVNNADLGNQGSGFELTVNTTTVDTTVSIDEKEGELTVQKFNTGNLTIDNSLVFTASGITKITPGNFLIGAQDYVEFTGTSVAILPAGTTAQRPGLTANDAGAIRFNTDESRFEGFDGSFFVSLGGVRDVDGNTFISAELNPGDDDNTLRFFNNGTNSLDIEETKLTLRSVVNIDSVDLGGITLWEASAAATAATLPDVNYVYFGTNVYSIDTTGTFGSVGPVHTTGTVTNGTVDLTYVRTIYGDVTYTGKQLNLSLNKLEFNTNAIGLKGDLTYSSLNSNSDEFGLILGEASDANPEFGFLKFTKTGAKLSVNNDYGTSESYIEVLDYQLQKLNLKDTRLVSATSTLDTSLGNATTAIFIPYDSVNSILPGYSGKVMIEVIDDSATSRRQQSEISFLVKSDLSDIIYVESNKIYTDDELCDVSVGLDGLNNVKVDIVDLTGSSTTVYTVKVVSQLVLD